MFNWLASRLASLDLAGDTVLLGMITRCLFKPLPPKAVGVVRHVVVYRVGNIGDTVIAIPALAAVRQRFPQARLTLLTSAGRNELPGASEVLKAFPGLVDNIVTYLPEELRRIKGMNVLKSEIQADGGAIDVFIELPVALQGFQRALQGIFLARWLGARVAFGFEPRLPELFRRKYAQSFPERIPQAAKWLLNIACGKEMAAIGSWEIVTPACAGASFPSEPRNDSFLSLFLPPALNFGELGLNPDRPVLAVNAGAKLAIKRWPPERFQQVLSQLIAAQPDLQIVLLGSAIDHALNQQIADGLPGHILNLGGRLNLSETWSLLQAASAVLSNDTGIMHMAGLLRKPVFTPMGGQWPEPLWHPPGEAFTAFRHAVPCAPCFLETCPVAGQPCLQGIDASVVAQAIQKALYESGITAQAPA